MSFDFLDLSPEVTFRLGAVAAVCILLALLIASFASRARVFCEYLNHMTGIQLRPSAVRAVFREKGRGGVRDVLISMLIQEDLADPSRVVTPDSEPDTSIYESDLFT